MTRHRIFPVSVLLFLGGLALPMDAQHDRREEGPRPDPPREEGRQPGRARESRSQAPAREPAPAERSPRGFERTRPEGPAAFGPPERPGRERRDREAPETRRPPSDRGGRPSSPRTAEATRSWQAREPWRRDAWPAHSTWREHRAHQWERDHRTWAQRGGYGGYRIPEPQFVSRFGYGHPFRIGSRPVIYQGYPRFRCGGYWFLIVDPWPEFWVDDWYLTDEVYVDYYVDGYYLFNPRYPGIRVALTVFL